MGDYVVQPGDGMGSIAAEHGYFWKALWDHPDNAELKRVRLNPHVLMPGDRVTLPPLEKKVELCATGKRHVFRRRGIPARIRFVVQSFDGSPFADKRYELTVGDLRYEGRTDGDGAIDRGVSPVAKTGELAVWLETPGYPEVARYILRIGYLEPVESIRGVQGRLNGLGYGCGEEDGELNEATRAALRLFQEKRGLDPKGEVDEATRSALREAYGI